MLGTKLIKEKMMKTILLAIAMLVGINSEARVAYDAYRMGASGNLPAWGKIDLANGTTGNAPKATNLAGGLGGQVCYQSAADTTAFLANGTAGQILQSNGTTLAPSWVSASGGTVTAVSVASANGFAGSSSGGATPALTLSTSITGILKGDGTAISAAIAGDFPTLNQNTTGTAASFTGNLTGDVTSTGMSTSISAATVTGKALTGYSIGTTVGTVAATDTILQAFQKIAGNQRIAEFDDGNSGASDTIDFSNGPAHKSTLTGNCTFTFSNPIAGQAYILKTVGDGTVRTITWPAAVKWAGGTAPTMTGTAGKFDLINFYYDGTDYLGSYTQNY